MNKLLVIFLIFNFLIFPVSVSAQEINLDQINLKNLNLDKLPDLSFDSPDGGVSPGEAINFFKKLYDLGDQVYKLVSEVWNIASSLIKEVTGLSLANILTELIN